MHASAEDRNSLPCDYARCSRAADPFSRKDHYRDHLRDYHKEDIGLMKTAKKKSPEERRVYSDWWRCAKCLARVSVAVDGWECRACRVTCEPERVAARQNMTTSNYESSLGEQEASTSSVGYSGSSSWKSESLSMSSGLRKLQPNETKPTYQQYSAPLRKCSVCNDVAWVQGDRPGWVPCPKCQPNADFQPTSHPTW